LIHIKKKGGNIPVLKTYRDAYLYWTENSENYKKLKSGKMEELSQKKEEQTEPALETKKGEELLETATVSSVYVLNAQQNNDLGTNNNSNYITDQQGNSCYDLNGDNVCSTNEMGMGGGGSLFFFDDIRKMLLKNRDAINSFLTNRNARKIRKGKRVNKTRNGRKHTTIYKRKARKHINTRKYK